MERKFQFDRTTRDIIDAFMDLLDQKSFEKISVQDIIEKAMINRSTFYRHFQDKYAILEYLQDKYVRALTLQSSAIHDAGITDMSQINHVLQDYFDANRLVLGKLLRIRTSQTDFSFELQKIMRKYFSDLFPALHESEIAMFAGMYIEYFIFNILHKSNNRIGTDFSEASANIMLAMFGLSPTRENHDDLLLFVKEHYKKNCRMDT
jgi:AcrR family transcriptional regulator